MNLSYDPFICHIAIKQSAVLYRLKFGNEGSRCSRNDLMTAPWQATSTVWSGHLLAIDSISDETLVKTSEKLSMDA
jgi:hypothetical protein